jgi:phosphopentomutase
VKVTLIVFDSVGIGAAPDAADFGDAGSATLPHIGEAVGGLRLPTLESLGLGNIIGCLPDGIPIPGVPPHPTPRAGFGAMQELSEGKDTITGHWEIAGLHMDPGFRLFPAGPPSFPPDLIESFERETGLRVLGNKAASGTAIIEELGEEHLRAGPSVIVYTSADSVFQIAAHEEVVGLDTLYAACRTARRLCDPLRVGRVIARPFKGAPGTFERTTNRKDFAFQTDEPTVLERLAEAGIPVWAVGKIEDIFAGRGIARSDHTGDTESSQRTVERFHAELDHGLIFANFIDFDMLYGHRRDPEGYAGALVQSDAWLADFLPRLGTHDLLLITADHGNDPTFHGTDHTREYVPLLAYQPGRPAENLGLRHGFFDIAQTLASVFAIPPMPRGRAFL